MCDYVSHTGGTTERRQNVGVMTRTSNCKRQKLLSI